VQVHRGVDIPVFRMTTTATDKYTVFQGQFIVERPTYPAHLVGGEPAIRDNDVGPIRLSLLHEHLPKAPKTSITDGARELVILHHPFDVQIFNDDLLVGGRKPGRQLVERIVANRRNPCVETSKLRLRPVPMRRPFDAAFRFGTVGHFRSDVRELGALATHDTADERRQGNQVSGDRAGRLARITLC
jgi:hypothetical protein